MQILFLFFIIIFSLILGIIVFYFIFLVFDFYFKKIYPKLVYQKKLTELWPDLNQEKSNFFVFNLNWAGFSVYWFKNILLAIALLAILFSIIFRDALPLYLGFGLFILLFLIVILKKNRRRSLFIQQLPNAIDALAQFQRAGYSLSSAISLVKRETTFPVSSVFDTLERANKYNLDFHSATQAIGVHLKLEEWNIVSEVLRIQSNMGGDIIPVLRDIAKTLREKLHINQEIQAATAPGRLSGTMIATLTPASLLFLIFTAPSYINILFSTNIGRMLLLTAITLELIGFILIQKMTKIDY